MMINMYTILVYVSHNIVYAIGCLHNTVTSSHPSLGPIAIHLDKLIVR